MLERFIEDYVFLQENQLEKSTLEILSELEIITKEEITDYLDAQKKLMQGLDIELNSPPKKDLPDNSTYGIIKRSAYFSTITGALGATAAVFLTAVLEIDDGGALGFMAGTTLAAWFIGGAGHYIYSTKNAKSTNNSESIDLKEAYENFTESLDNIREKTKNRRKKEAKGALAKIRDFYKTSYTQFTKTLKVIS